jgi:RimJ/RimL family protein N-acetyltransferase
MQPVRAVRLADDVVTLEPLTPEHAERLWQAAAGPRDTFTLSRVPATLQATREYIEGALAELTRGVSVPFATCDARSGRVVGSTRFMTIERWTWAPAYPAEQRASDCADALEIGSTWLAPAVQRTAINTHAKLLMLTHAFESWEVRRVTLKTDARNARSRAAIERLGAHFDGVLRGHMPAFDGAVRDTAFYSIVANEWPAVRAGLQARVHRPG